MKPIENISIWKNGEIKNANLLNANITRDNMLNFCEFYYQLCSSGQGTEAMPLVIGEVIADGKLTMSGEQYLAWEGSNNFAFTYIADKLNLTLI
jgi:hypothetical protein